MAQTNVGLDLGSNSIKVVELAKTGNKQFKLVNGGIIATPPASLFSESTIEQEAVSSAIKHLLKEAKINNNEVRVALPEAQVFTLVIETPPISEKELASSINWEAEQYIPMPLDEVVLDWKILVQGKKTNEKNQVLLVAAPKRVIEKYQYILDKADLNPLCLETELIATSRALMGSVPQLKNLMIVNMGAETTDFSLLNEGTLLFTRSVATGGLAFTRAIKQNLQLEESQAEEYKKAYGLEEDKLEGKVANILKPLVSSIVAELEKGVSFYHEKFPDRQIEVILLAGGSSLLPGLIPFIVDKLGIETQIGNPFSFVSIDNKLAPNFNLSQSAVYTVATGLAMREKI